MVAVKSNAVVLPVGIGVHENVEASHQVNTGTLLQSLQSEHEARGWHIRTHVMSVHSYLKPCTGFPRAMQCRKHMHRHETCCPDLTSLISETVLISDVADFRNPQTCMLGRCDSKKSFMQEDRETNKKEHLYSKPERLPCDLYQEFPGSNLFMTHVCNCSPSIVLLAALTLFS